MTIHNKLYDLPFDQFSRQIQVKAVIDCLRLETDTLNILDVGGYMGATALTLPGDNVTVIDVFNVIEDHYIKGDGTHLPFKDDEFDFVLSFDVLEHVPEDNRQRFLEESARVAKRGVMTAFPVKSVQNEYAEVSLNQLYKQLHHKNHKWLKEHIDNAIPDSDKILTIFNKLDLKSTVLTSNNTDLWLLMQATIFINSKYPELDKNRSILNRQYNTLYDGFDGMGDISDNYRHICIGLKTKEDYRKIGRWVREKSKRSAEIKKRKIQTIEYINTFYKNNIVEFGKEIDRLRSKNEYLSAQVKQLENTNGQIVQTISDIVDSRKYKLVEKIAKLQHTLKAISGNK